MILLVLLKKLLFLTKKTAELNYKSDKSDPYRLAVIDYAEKNILYKYRIKIPIIIVVIKKEMR